MSELVTPLPRRAHVSDTKFLFRPGRDLSHLRADLDRFAFLLDGSGGESLFHLDGNGDG